MYGTLSHEKTDSIITFAQFKEGDLVENECNAEEYEWILASIDELSTENDYDNESISENYFEDIWGGSKIHLEPNARDSRLKIRDSIKQK